MFSVSHFVHISYLIPFCFSFLACIQIFLQLKEKNKDSQQMGNDQEDVKPDIASLKKNGNVNQAVSFERNIFLKCFFLSGLFLVFRGVVRS